MKKLIFKMSRRGGVTYDWTVVTDPFNDSVTIDYDIKRVYIKGQHKEDISWAELQEEIEILAAQWVVQKERENKLNSILRKNKKLS